MILSHCKPDVRILAQHRRDTKEANAAFRYVLHTVAHMGVGVESSGIEGACFHSLQFTLLAAISVKMLQLDLKAPFIFADCHERWIQSTWERKFILARPVFCQLLSRLTRLSCRKKKKVCESLNEICSCATDILNADTKVTLSSI